RAAAALVALRSSDGAQLWRVSAGEHTLGAPSIVGGVLYVSDGDGLSARLATDGALLWHVRSAAIAPDLLACTCLQPYVSVAPIVAHGQLFATISVAYLPHGAASVIVALDAQTGATRWRYPQGDTLPGLVGSFAVG